MSCVKTSCILCLSAWSHCKLNAVNFSLLFPVTKTAQAPLATCVLPIRNKVLAGSVGEASMLMTLDCKILASTAKIQINYFCGLRAVIRGPYNVILN